MRRLGGRCQRRAQVLMGQRYSHDGANSRMGLSLAWPGSAETQDPRASCVPCGEEASGEGWPSLAKAATCGG
jgi:hypothetical protein